jgi:hypothetical protein
MTAPNTTKIRPTETNMKVISVPYTKLKTGNLQGRNVNKISCESICFTSVFSSFCVASIIGTGYLLSNTPSPGCYFGAFFSLFTATASASAVYMIACVHNPDND